MHHKGELNLTLEPLKEAQFKCIKRVVCSGGGAKGVVYPGSYKAMEDTGVFKGVEELSGASAGAITSTMLALGMPSAVFRDKLLTTNLKNLMGSRIGSLFGTNPPGVSAITRDGKPLEDFIRENIISSVKTNIASIEKIETIAASDQTLQDLLAKLKTKFPVITFGDLALLNHHFPDKFKQLNMPAVEFPNGAIQVFNSTLTPDVEIALACRASASIPVILKPVTITINGVEKQFVDGGLYDNLPTDYFDLQEDGTFSKNTKPEQTLVFAFGEGLDNKTNQVFQALYGSRWDEIFEDQLFESLIRQSMLLDQYFDPDVCQICPKKMAAQQKKSIELFLKKRVSDKTLTTQEAHAIRLAMNKALNSLLLNTDENQPFWMAYREENDAEKRSMLLIGVIKEKMKPVLYDAGIIEQLKRDTLVQFMGGLNTPYKNTDQKEIGYHKLRSEYSLRTVELRVGGINTTSFDEATKVARIMDALGYLDTINHITNHNLHDPNIFNEEKFYVDTVTRFKSIYHGVLAGSKRDIKRDKLTKCIRALEFDLRSQGKSQEQISRQVFQLIKDNVERNLKSPEAFALSRAVEYHNKVLTEEELFKETYEEGCKRCGHFSVSNITGEPIYGLSSLHESIKEKDMFELYLNQPAGNTQTRMDKVFASLENLFVKHPNEQGIAEYNTSLKAFETALATFIKTHSSVKDQQFHENGYRLFVYIKKLTAGKPNLMRPKNLAEITTVLSCATKTIQEIDDKDKTEKNVSELAKLSQQVLGKSSVWKNIGIALLSLACAALVCIGILAAIPSSGTSLLMAAVGAAGLGVTAAAGTMVASSAVIGGILFVEGSEKGLARSVSLFKTALGEIAKDDPEEFSTGLTQNPFIRAID
ncbi:TPA: patatin-like phospholipase family protein [Legionella pneumophila]|nr:patatin-like phospholipase family protein [Legionella pneumophila]HAT8843033.1 esterase [Legionella pneumophila subsp. pneumophila]MCK1858437.1 patatin-like phospholipase family protein [Legionella pneumophila]HAT2106258.1 patatin-like phospholipase family protein [Legionella pneumophila]HAT9517240.1 esterase [Legionella pneumophila subsp. pneumophila]HAT9587961.1 esterase [Legionella pneumophila subsp. pneumophila]